VAFLSGSEFMHFFLMFVYICSVGGDLSRKANLGIVIKTVVYRRAHVLITLFVFVCA
jgi:hypothetical protein